MVRQTVAGIVLAAGMSTRMGSFKPLLPLGDRTVIEVVVEKVRSRLDRVFVILGHRGDEIAAVLGRYQVECVHNSEYPAGMLSSVKCGLRASSSSAYLVCLGDQPGLNPKVIDAVLSASELGKGIVIPTYHNRRGHPMLIYQHYVEEILSQPPCRGLNTVTRGHPEDTLEVPVSGRGILEDMDTPGDYRREQARWGADRGQDHG